MEIKKHILINCIFTALLSYSPLSQAASVDIPQKEDIWFKQAQADIEKAKVNLPINKPAKNVILFVGDGMSIGTITGARIYEGQRRGLMGEEYRLNMETMPVMALSKTYNTDAQTPDSAGTASAMVTGVKTSQGVTSVNESVKRGVCNTVKGNESKSAWEMAAEKGMSVGVVSSARITHATPAATYAHSADRDWESDANMPDLAKDQGCLDIAQQLINFNNGKGMDVVFGGGRREFLPSNVVDPEGKKGNRKDGLNLIEKWQSQHPDGQYIYDQKGFDSLPNNAKKYLVCLKAVI